MIAAALLLSASTQVNNQDAIFSSWCTDVGISCPGAEVRTTPASVAGRGVFSTKDLAKDEEIISIPYHAALTQDNAAMYFPTLHKELVAIRNTKKSRIRRIWNHIRRRRSAQEESNDDDYWQAELAAYALAALDRDHPWSTWISQWQRDDPMQTLVDQSNWQYDEDAINKAVAEFQKMAPDISEYKIAAAVGIRLEKLDEYLDKYISNSDQVQTDSSLYSTLLSRAVGLSETTTAVLPMHDMINHSSNPNVGMVLDGEDLTFKLVATTDIPKDSELFISYMKVLDDEGKWDEDKATWLLVQWGIPSSSLMETALESDDVLSENEKPRGKGSSYVGLKRSGT